MMLIPMRHDIKWETARDLEDLPNDQANAYNRHIQAVMAERAEQVVEAWYQKYRKEVEEHPEKAAAREYYTIEAAKRRRIRNKKKPMQAVVEKTCFKCHEVKPLNKFYSGRNACRSCFKAQQRASVQRRQGLN